MSRWLRNGALALVTATATVIGFAVSGTPTEATPPSQRAFSGTATVTKEAERGERHTVAQPPAATPPAIASLDPLLVRVLELTNIERARVGLPALTVDAQLNEAAQFHSDDQARRNTLTHHGPNGESPGDRIEATGYRFRMWAENAAMGYRTAETVMRGWMNSSGHRANILRANVSDIGLGLAYTPSGTPYWTQVFAEPR